jgi:hypothetical protein
LDGDGDFKTNDLVSAFQDGGYEKGPRPAVAVVPEPSGDIVLDDRYFCSYFMIVLLRDIGVDVVTRIH